MFVRGNKFVHLRRQIRVLGEDEFVCPSKHISPLKNTNLCAWRRHIRLSEETHLSAWKRQFLLRFQPEKTYLSAWRIQTCWPSHPTSEPISASDAATPCSAAATPPAVHRQHRQRWRSEASPRCVPATVKAARRRYWNASGFGSQYGRPIHV